MSLSMSADKMQRSSRQCLFQFCRGNVSIIKKTLKDVENRRLYHN